MSRHGRYTPTYRLPKSVKFSFFRELKSFFVLVTMQDFWRTVWELVFIAYVKTFRKYYTHIDYLPLFNFAEILKGKFEYIYHKPNKGRVPRIYFVNIFKEMNFQFHTLDNDNLRLKADRADYHSKWVRTKDPRWLNEYNTIDKKIKDIISKPFDIASFTNYIEMTFGHAPGTINPMTISTQKVFMMYQEAVDRNRAIQRNKTQKRNKNKR